MEQPNMMPNGMPGQVPQGGAMQRAQSGNVQQQIFAKIITDLRNSMGTFTGGWQATFDPRTRGNLIMQLVTALRMLERDIPKCISIAQRFEHQSISNAQTRAQYESSMQAKLEEIRQKRASTGGQMMPNNLNGQQLNPGNAAMNMQQARGLMQPPQQNNNMSMQGQAAGFPAQLQRPMQPSPLQHHPQSQPNALDPSFLINPTQPSPQIQMPAAQNNNMMQNVNPLAAQHTESIELQSIATHMMNSLAHEKKSCANSFSLI